MYRSDGSKTQICPGSMPASAIIAISVIVATADARGPHQGQCGCRRPFIALFVARKYKSSMHSDISSMLEQSRASTIRHRRHRHRCHCRCRRHRRRRHLHNCHRHDHCYFRCRRPSSRPVWTLEALFVARNDKVVFIVICRASWSSPGPEPSSPLLHHC